jgi:hypothetical protein
MPSNDAFFLLDPNPLFQTPVSKKRMLPSSNPPAVRKVVRPTKMSSRTSTEISAKLLVPVVELESHHQSRATVCLKRRRSSEARELEQCFPSFDCELDASIQESSGDIAKNVTPLTPRVRIGTSTIASPIRKKIRTIKNIITP